MTVKKTQSNRSAPYRKGFVGAITWQRGQPLATPSEDYTESEIRDWVRGWNVGVASGQTQA